MPKPSAPFHPAAAPKKKNELQLSGLEPLIVNETTGFINVGERTNVTGSKKVCTPHQGRQLRRSALHSRQQVENGAQVIDVNVDEGMLDSEQVMQEFLNLIASEPEISRVPVMIDSSKWSVIEKGLQCVQGKSIVNSISLKEGEEPFRQRAGKILEYGAAAVVMAFDEEARPTASNAVKRYAGVHTAFSPGRSVSPPKTSSSTPMCLLLQQALKSTTTTRLTS